MRERSEWGRGGEEMEERQKVEEIKREQMGHEGVERLGTAHGLVYMHETREDLF